jgi:hypothetical protein
MIHDNKLRAGAAYDLISMDEDDRNAVITDLLSGSDPDTVITRTDVRQAERKRKAKTGKRGKGKSKGRASKQLAFKEIVLEIEAYTGKTEQEEWGPPQKILANVLDWIGGKFGLKALTSRIQAIHDDEA